MSVTVEFAFNAEGTLADVGDRVRAALGADLRPYEGNPEDLFCRFLGLELSLSANTLVDAGDIDFSRYRFVLGTRTVVDEVARRAYKLEATALLAHVLLLDGVAREGILVYDTQLLLARYAARDGAIYDLLSVGPVYFPDHMADLRERLEA